MFSRGDSDGEIISSPLNIAPTDPMVFTSPWDGFNTPQMTRNKVDFPAPFRPTSPTRSWSFISKDKLSNADFVLRGSYHALFLRRRSEGKSRSRSPVLRRKFTETLSKITLAINLSSIKIVLVLTLPSFPLLLFTLLLFVSAQKHQNAAGSGFQIKIG